MKKQIVAPDKRSALDADHSGTIVIESVLNEH